MARVAVVTFRGTMPASLGNWEVGAALLIETAKRVGLEDVLTLEHALA